jgi:hypothetical protein
MAMVQLNKPNPILLVRMNNMLDKFEELLLNNTCSRCTIRPWETKTPNGRSGGK